MKRIVMMVVGCLLSMHLLAQDYDEPVKNKKEKPPKKEIEKPKILRPLRCPGAYLGVSTGINNNTGLIGIDIDVPVDKFVSIDGGAGIGSWGYKLALGAKYYLQPCQRGWAFGGGLTYSTGLGNYQQDMETINGTETVSLNLHPQTNLFLAAYRYWSLGKRYNRFFLELGYSVSLTGGDKYDEVIGDPLSDNSKTTMRLISPGGIIIGAGFSFGLN